MDNVQDIAKAAAQWWSDALVEGSKGSSGDPMIDLLNRMLREGDPPPSEAALATFRAEIERLVVERLDRFSGLSLSVDYGPDIDLTRALAAAKITAQLPIKTTMWIERDGVSVRAGYRAPSVRLWPRDEPSAKLARFQQEDLT